MFERLQKPFLTVETGEAYQPIRLSYDILQDALLQESLNHLLCLEAKGDGTGWHWYWRNECESLHFESLDSFKKHPTNPLRLGTITLRDGMLYINLPSFKRACIAVAFFHKLLTAHHLVKLRTADFINKVFGLNERLPHGFAELFKEEELIRIVSEREHEYEKMQSACEGAKTADEALNILSQYTNTESRKKLPYAERYAFDAAIDDEADENTIFLGFYIFLRGRELVAIRRWFGETGYSLADAAEETVEKVFGGVDIDIIE